MHARALGLASLIVSLGVTSAVNVRAHALLEAPAPRDDRDGYKDSTPCGVTRASDQPATRYSPGQSLNVEWRETVDHAGCFLIEFSAQGDQDFQVLGRKTHSNPPPPVDVTSAEPRRWSMPVVLPNVSCEECTLRLRQIMVPEDLAEDACPPPTTPVGSVYTTCANISLVGGGGGSASGGGSATAEVDAAATDNEGSACTFSARRPATLLGAMLLVLAALGCRRGAARAACRCSRHHVPASAPR